MGKQGDQGEAGEAGEKGMTGLRGPPGTRGLPGPTVRYMDFFMYIQSTKRTILTHHIHVISKSTSMFSSLLGPTWYGWSKRTPWPTWRCSKIFILDKVLHQLHDFLYIIYLFLLMMDINE